MKKPLLWISLATFIGSLTWRAITYDREGAEMLALKYDVAKLEKNELKIRNRTLENKKKRYERNIKMYEKENEETIKIYKSITNQFNSKKESLESKFPFLIKTKNE